MAHGNGYRRLNPAQFADLLGRSQQAPAAALPVVTFDETITFHWNGEETDAFHVEPSHTDGDAVVHYRGPDVVHMGDTFFNGRYPFIDVDSGGNVDGLISTADRVLRLAGSNTRVIPGHGELSSRDDLRAYREMLSTGIGRVAQLIGDGSSQEEVVSANPTADFDAVWETTRDWTQGFVALVYRSLAEGP